MNLEEFRIQIDNCNEQILKCLKRRFDLTRKVGILKKQQNLPSYDKSREDIILNKIKLSAKNNNLDENMVENIFRIIMKQVVKEHEEIKNVDK